VIVARYNNALDLVTNFRRHLVGPASGFDGKLRVVTRRTFTVTAKK
jgi:hypothetical protein